jgi:hypothetical protein
MMHVRDRMDEHMRPAWGNLAAAVVTCSCIAGAVHAGDQVGGVPEVSIANGKPLWLSANVKASAAAASKESAPVVMGRGSSSLKQIAARVLAERYPCAAVTLTVFEPPRSREGKWEFQLESAPTAHTAALIAANAEHQQIEKSMNVLGTVPYDPYDKLHLSVKVVTDPIAADASVSTIVCEVVDSYGRDLQKFEPSVRAVWRASGPQLLGLYETAAATTTAANSTPSGMN